MNGGGFKDTVLWNPFGNEAMGADKFVCVESAALDPVSLAPGAEWTGTLSLVPTALTEEEMEYDLPPLSRITLQRVDEAGSWQAYGVTVNQRLLTVSVAFAFPWARG